MTDEELKNQVALVCMMVSNPSGGEYPDGWKRRANDLLRSLRDELLEARALLADCNEYLKEDETPRQRMDRDHKDVLALLEMLASDRKRRDEAEAANGRYLYLLQGVLKTAKQGHSIATQVWIEAIENTLKGTTK